MNDIYNKLKREVESGIQGDNAGISIGFPGLDNYISIRKRIYTHIFGSSGTGKSSFASCAYILNPFDWWWKNRHNTKTKIKFIYFSMERSSVHVTGKWICRKIFLNHGILIPFPKLMGWPSSYGRLTHDEHDLFLKYDEYFKNMEDIVYIVDGKQTPTAIDIYLREFAEKHGKISTGKYSKFYQAENEDLITIILVDHQSLIKKEKGMANKKEAIDTTSSHLQNARDLYGFSPVLVAQMNRDIANPAYQKLGSFEPVPEQIKDSGTPYEDSDVCISLFDPLKFNTKALTGHDAKKLYHDETGAKYYRSLKIHKSSWSEDDIRKGLAFHGAIGHFKELPKYNLMTDDDYKSVLDGTYFLI